ncbi:MAG: cytochrome c oxidase subunit 3 [Gemmatimonas sp.]
MKTRSVLNVSELPTWSFGHLSLMWWGTLGFMLIEGTVFVLAVAMYFYLMTIADQWPLNVAPPSLTWGTVFLGVLLLSIWPNHWAERVAKEENLHKVRRGLILTAAFGIVLIGIRVFEFRALNIRWDENAYGSVLWLLLGLHTTHLVTDVVDTLVLTALMMTGPLHKKRYSDVTDNAFYWDFVVLAWIPIYAVLYWAPRLGG